MNKIIQGDCIEEMKLLNENSVDAIITDPPYGLGFMNKEWDSPQKHRDLVEREIKRSVERKAEGKSPTDAPFSKSVQPGLAIKGAKENRWFQEWSEKWGKEAFRVLKPGGYMLVCCATRMYHRMTCGIEDAGFEIRDTISWLYGQGFPKSLNIGKKIDQIQGNEREVIGEKIRGDVEKAKQGVTFAGADANKGNKDIFGYGKEILTKGNSEWEGWGTALKPACEPIVVARKPLSEKNVSLNVLKWGTGGINIDDCRVGSDGGTKHIEGEKEYDNEIYGKGLYKEFGKVVPNLGRFPANILLSCFCEKMRLKEDIPFKIKKEIEEYYGKKS